MVLFTFPLTCFPPFGRKGKNPLDFNFNKNLIMSNKENQNIPVSKFSEWGKLGGRPPKDLKRSKVVSLRLTPAEFSVIELKANDKNLKLPAYCRFILTETTIPNAEQNKTLIKFANNFSKIKNYMQMGIFNENEKKRLIAEIERTIFEIRNVIKWL